MAESMFNWNLLAPILIVLGGGVIGVLLEAFVPRAARWLIQTVFSLVVLGVALVSVVLNWTVQGAFLAQTELLADPAAWRTQALIIVIALLTVLVMADRTSAGDGAFAAQPSDRPGSVEEQLSLRAGVQRSEIFPLVLLSTGGMMVFPMASSLLTMFVALEVFSLPLYILCATARRRRLLSQESAIKYFALGAFASTFFLMGTALIFGITGSVNLYTISQVMSRFNFATLSADAPTLFLLLGLTLVVIALLFKVAAAPFHAWTPDVYQGAPTPITGFMAAGVKVAAFMAILRIWSLLGAYVAVDLKWFFIFVIIATIVVGTFTGLVQNNAKRMLAYSSIAHAGFILIAFLTVNANVGPAPLAVISVRFYLLAYAIATVGAFAVFTLVREQDANGLILGEANMIDQFNGLGKTNPWLASALTVFLLSFAGIPLSSGFIAKFMVFSAGIANGALWIVIVAVAASAITAYYYFRMVVAMFFKEPHPGTVVVSSEGPTVIVIVICVAVTILAGILPQPFLEML